MLSSHGFSHRRSPFSARDISVESWSVPLQQERCAANTVVSEMSVSNLPSTSAGKYLGKILAKSSLTGLAMTPLSVGPLGVTPERSGNRRLSRT